MKSVYAIIDARSPASSIRKLKQYVDNVFCFSSTGITYNSISGHPDIFMFQDAQKLIIAPNAPEDFIHFLETRNINFTFGSSRIGKEFPDSVQYNCIADNTYFFHKKGFTDEKIIEHIKNRTFIELPQAYTRCSMISLKNEHYVSSDRGIQKKLDEYGLHSFYFSPADINIIDHANGFFGGTCGLFQNKIFFNGNILKHNDGKKLSELLETLNYEVICLHNDCLYDGGAIFFLESST